MRKFLVGALAGVGALFVLLMTAVVVFGLNILGSMFLQWFDPWGMP